MQVLALSSSRVGNGGYLEEAGAMIGAFLGNKPKRVAFLPFAAVDGDYEVYGQKVQDGLAGRPYTINTAAPGNAAKLIEEADAVMIGGGNTFKLLHDIYQLGLFTLIQQKVQSGTPYIGWSAGSNLTGESICTTNDMPIIQPQSFMAFGFLPFQINPHYHNVVVEGFNGETRDQRLTEFLLLNPGVPVVGLPEGAALHLTGDALAFKGKEPAYVFQNTLDEKTPVKKELLAGKDLSFLMHRR